MRIWTIHTFTIESTLVFHTRNAFGLRLCFLNAYFWVVFSWVLNTYELCHCIKYAFCVFYFVYYLKINDAVFESNCDYVSYRNVQFRRMTIARCDESTVGMDLDKDYRSFRCLRKVSRDRWICRVRIINCEHI